MLVLGSLSPSEKADLCSDLPLRYSVTESVFVSRSCGVGGDDEDQALQERMAKREERRQRRMKEALERQKQLDPTAVEAGDGVGLEKNSTEEERPSRRSRRYRDTVEDEEKTEIASSRQEKKEQEEPREEEEEPALGRDGEEEEVEQKAEVVESKPSWSYLREQVSMFTAVSL